MYCNKCGQEISEDAKFCPFCGAEQTREVVEVEEDTTNTPAKNVFAIIGFINGILCLSFFWCPFFGIEAIPGIIFSAVGLGSRDKAGKASTGLTLNILALVLNIVITIVMFVLMFEFGDFE